MRSRTLGTAAALVLALAALGAPAAQAQQQPDYAKAKQHYTEGMKAMAAGEFAIAAREFGIVYDITRDPVLFYNIAEANDKAGNCRVAIIYYGRYLREGKPDDAYRKLTEERLAVCRAQEGSGGTAPGDPAEPAEPADPAVTGPTAPPDPAPADPPPTTTTPPPDPGDLGDAPPTPPVLPPDGPPAFLDEAPTWKRSAGWISVGVTLAAATTGAVLGLSARSRQEDLENLIKYRDPATQQPAVFEGNTARRYEDLREEGRKLDTYAKISFGVAGAAALAATLFFVLDATSGDGGSEGGASLAPVLGPDGLGFAAAWEF